MNKESSKHGDGKAMHAKNRTVQVCKKSHFNSALRPIFWILPDEAIKFVKNALALL